MRHSKRRFEVVLVSCERDEDAFANRGLPFLAVPFDAPERHGAMRHFQITAIPRLIILDPFGAILVDNALAGGHSGGLSVELVDGWLKAAKAKLYDD
mmetsp:Transcript_17839/g.54535  ORF Transcript_17839/g.54535 Transcript_17839/m.54535 type:complete len:97 (+) Transcript_17839:652-942(+)